VASKAATCRLGRISDWCRNHFWRAFARVGNMRARCSRSFDCTTRRCALSPGGKRCSCHRTPNLGAFLRGGLCVEGVKRTGMSALQCPLSNVRSLMSALQCPLSNVRSPMSALQCPLSGGRLRSEAGWKTRSPVRGENQDKLPPLARRPGWGPVQWVFSGFLQSFFKNFAILAQN